MKSLFVGSASFLLQMLEGWVVNSLFIKPISCSNRVIIFYYDKKCKFLVGLPFYVDRFMWFIGTSEIEIKLIMKFPLQFHHSMSVLEPWTLIDSEICPTPPLLPAPLAQSRFQCFSVGHISIVTSLSFILVRIKCYNGFVWNSYYSALYIALIE